ncbi:MAG: hypothetical protein JWQ08_564 [Deinococcus sp.]|nr:hypothetical protein [Deinococcus sp.]
MMAFPLASPAAPGWIRGLMWGVPLVLVVVAFVPDPPQAASVPHWDVLILGILLAALVHFAPRRLRYRLTSEGLVITRLTGTTVLPLVGMQARPTAGRLGIRTFGTGLPGYLTGAFSFTADQVRSVTALASAGSGGILVGLPVKKASSPPLRWYFLTPADPDLMLRELAARGVAVNP